MYSGLLGIAYHLSVTGPKFTRKNSYLWNRLTKPHQIWYDDEHRSYLGHMWSTKVKVTMSENVILRDFTLYIWHVTWGSGLRGSRLKVIGSKSKVTLSRSNKHETKYGTFASNFYSFTRIKVTGKWAHINIKLLHYSLVHLKPKFLIINSEYRYSYTCTAWSNKLYIILCLLHCYSLSQIKINKQSCAVLPLLHLDPTCTCAKL